MIAILGGFGAALCWAAATMGSARSARSIGSWSTLAWVMMVGLAVTIPTLLFTGGHVVLGSEQLAYLALSGVANVAGLLLGYTALRRGKVAVVAPIVSTEGAIGALIAMAAGEPVAAGATVVLAVIVVGIVLATTERKGAPANPPGPGEAPPASGASPVVTAVIAVAAATCFGVNLFAGARIASDLPVAWAILPPRLLGTIGVALPLLVSRRLRLNRTAAPFVLLVGLVEVIGTASFALGSREGIAIASVTSSQFGALAAVAAWVLFRERLSRLQIVGVATIAAGVAVLSALTA